jgi:threonine dehydrogenase-like Zn-dependent dehydrogenase
MNSGLKPGETVAVIGCEPVGMMAIQSAFALGAARVIAIDLMRERTEMAATVGARYGLHKSIRSRASMN